MKVRPAVRSALGAAFLSCTIFANISAQAAELKTEDGKDYGTLDGRVLVITTIHGKHNGYDLTTGDSYSLELKYKSPTYHGLSFGVTPYINGDLFGLTDFGVGKANPTERIAGGMFLDPDGDTKAVLGEYYLQYKDDKFYAKVGAQSLDTPLTKTRYNHVPNFYRAVDLGTTALKNFTFGATYIDQMMLGTRSLGDFALIGEGTNTAGATGIAQPGQYTPENYRGDFRDISETALGPGAPDTNGIIMLSAQYAPSKKFKAGLWYQHVDEFADNIYGQVDSVFGVGGPYKLALSGQFLHQSDNGDALVGYEKFLPQNADGTDLDYSLLGAKATLIGKGWSVFAAFNKSFGDTAFFNAWGADPAYTSSIFSYNAYRQDVTAYKFGAKIKLLKNLVFIGSYANYGKSKTQPAGIGIVPNISPAADGCGGPKPACVPSNDATEADFVLAYKPRKDLTLRLLQVFRRSEYDDATPRDLTESSTRFIATYKF